MDVDHCEAEILYSRDYPPLRPRVSGLSPEGLTIHEAVIVPGGVPVTIRLRLPGAPRALSLRGSIHPRPDMGDCEVRFTGPSRAARAAIARFLKVARSGDTSAE